VNEVRHIHSRDRQRIVLRARQSKTDLTMVRFFAGNWSCTGEFASGKKIEAAQALLPNSMASGSSTVTMTGHLGRSRL